MVEEIVAYILVGNKAFKQLLEEAGIRTDKRSLLVGKKIKETIAKKFIEGGKNE